MNLRSEEITFIREALPEKALEYIEKNIEDSDEMSVFELRDELDVLSVLAMDEDDNPTAETFYVERILDVLLPFVEYKWRDIKALVS